MSQEAPGALDVVRRFVNTTDLEKGTEELSSPRALVGWLRAAELLDDGGGDASAADLRRALGLREALRELLLGHHGGHEVDLAALEAIDAAARRAGVALRFSPDGAAHLAPEREGVDGAFGRLLAIVAAAQRDGTWERLKACPWETCRWAFYDSSRNRSRTWCSMDVCGNRAKAQAFRARRRGAD